MLNKLRVLLNRNYKFLTTQCSLYLLCKAKAYVEIIYFCPFYNSYLFYVIP